jgi:tetratricopeptide (TPR) repeat protein
MAFHKAKALQEAEKSVAQGKIAQAIKQYQEILDNDPSDVSLLNTVGDLYIRDRNTTEGLRQFHKLAEAYVHEGFNVKAIAIYKKIAKVDPNSVENLLKLAEVYQLQGLAREAREQYLQATDYFKKRNQIERALEVLRKLVQLDPENINFHNRLAAEFEQAGKREEAAQTYLESAEILLHRNDHAGAEAPLKKASELNPKDAKIPLLRARVAITRQQPEEAEKIINATPELQADPAAKRILLDAYLATHKIPEAEKLVLEVFHSNPTDFAPVSSLAGLLVEKGDLDHAYQLLERVAEPLINQNNAGPLLESLRQIWNKAPKHIPTLELMHRVCERTADELTLPEVLEALGHVQEEAGNFEAAEAAYRKLADREPENEHYHGLLNAVQEKLGREVKPVEFLVQATPLAVAEELPHEPASVDANQEALVKEALENSDLFARYNLTEKAITELEKVLQIYPDQVEVHRRILEISRKGFPERGVAAAQELARIFTARGDLDTAGKYQAVASGRGNASEIPLPPPVVPPSEKVEEPAPPSPPASESTEAGAPMEFPISAIAPEEPVAAEVAPPPDALSFDLTPPAAAPEPPALPPQPPVQAEPAMELDLSGDLEAMSAFGFQPPAPLTPEPVAPPPVEILAPVEEPPPPPVEEAAHEEALPTLPEPPPAPPEEAAPADLIDSKIEVEFYLENGFVEEAQRTVSGLEEKYPGNPLVAELRQRLIEQALGAALAELPAHVVAPEEAVISEPAAEIAPTEESRPAEPPIEVAEAQPEISPPLEPAPEEAALPTGFEVTAQTEPAEAPVQSFAAAPEAPAPALEPAAEEEVPAEGGGMDMLGDLAGDLASSLEGLAPPPEPPPATSAPASAASAPPTARPAQGAAQLSGLLAEMEEPGAAPADKDDRETHYNLGVAFREMGLLEEAIGEFQKVVRGAGKGVYPANFLQACSLLAICFMEKKMPAIAVRWYMRALDTPGLEEEALMALQYDLGMAYEQAGDARRALERYIEVYSQNIDFRDVADKIRELQQKT